MPKTVRLQDETYSRLAGRGKWGQTMDEIVLNVLDAAEKRKEIAPRQQ